MANSNVTNTINQVSVGNTQGANSQRSYNGGIAHNDTTHQPRFGVVGLNTTTKLTENSSSTMAEMKTSVALVGPPTHKKVQTTKTAQVSTSALTMMHHGNSAGGVSSSDFAVAGSKAPYGLGERKSINFKNRELATTTAHISRESNFICASIEMPGSSKNSGGMAVQSRQHQGYEAEC